MCGKQPEHLCERVVHHNNLSICARKQQVRNGLHREVHISIVIDSHDGVRLVANLEIKATIAVEVYDRGLWQGFKRIDIPIREENCTAALVASANECLIAVLTLPS